MSISSEISRLTQAKADIKTAIENKGVTVPSNAKLNDYPDLIDDIEQGSTPNLQRKTVSITENGTTTVEPDPGYDGLSEVGVSVNVQGGGGGELAKENDVNFIDYDGTILHSYTAEEFLALTEMPENPTHEGLTSQGWNWTLTDAKTQVAEMGTCDIGQMYITDDGKTRIYIELHEGRLSPYLGICLKGTVEIDWGDGSKETVNGSSLYNAVFTPHSYADEGKYCITLNVLSGSFRLAGDSNGCYLLTKENKVSSNTSQTYSNAIKKVFCGSGIKVGSYAFTRCYSLESITFHKDMTNFEAYAFSRCYNLCYIVIPSMVSTIPNACFQNCFSLRGLSLSNKVSDIGASVFDSSYSFERISIPFNVSGILNSCFTSCYALKQIRFPKKMTSLSNSIVSYCYALSDIYIPNGIRSIGSYFVSNCNSLPSITIPNTISSISNNAFSNCYGVGEYHFLSTTPPTLGGTSVFNNIQSDCKIYVPAESLEAYKTATNWSTHASKMVGE